MSENPFTRHARSIVPEAPEPAAPTNPFARHARAQANDEREALRGAAITASQRDPDRFARAQQIASRTGYPVDVVADNQDEFEQRDRLAQLDDLATRAPRTAAFLRDPRRMALAQDDTDRLARIESKVRITGEHRPMPEPSYLEELVGQAHSAWIRGKNAVTTFLMDPVIPNLVDDNVARGLGYRSAEDYAQTQRSIRYAQENRRAAAVEQSSADTRDQQNRIANADGWIDSARAIAASPRAVGVTIAQSLGQGAPVLAASAAGATMGPFGTAAAAGGGSFAVEYGNAIATAMQRAGVDDTDPRSVHAFLTDPAKLRAARSYATKRGVPIAIFDALTAGFAGRLLAGSRGTVVSTTARSAGEAGVQAGGGAAGELTAQVVSGDKINPADVLMEAFAEVPSTVIEAPGNLRHARSRAVEAEVARIMRSAEGAADLAEFTQTAAESKLGERSPADLEAFVVEAGERDVYLEAETARVLFQSANLDPDETAASLTGTPEALAEAETSGGDLVIPGAKWASLVARLPNAPEFTRHARFEADALSRAEMEQYDIASLATEAAPDTPDEAFATSVRRIEDDVATMLTATAGYSSKDVERQAKLYGAMFGTLARRLETDAYSLYEPFGLQIRRDGATPFQRIGTGLRKAASRVGLVAPPKDARVLPQGERGRMLILSGRQIRIELLEDADASTFLHESAHFFWEVFSDAAARPDAPAGVKADYEAALRWFGVQSPDDVTTEHLEQWARGFEHYLAEGKAPSRELQSAFARFRAWLLDVYRDLKRLRVDVSDDIRGVFDRMLAIDEEIALAQRHAAPLDLGAEPKSLGLTEKQWADYVATTQAAREEAAARLAAEAVATRTAEAQSWRAERREEIRAEVEQQIETSPGARAIRILSGAAQAESDALPAELRDLKLDRFAMEATYGLDRVASEFKPLGIIRDGGADPEAVASLLEFPSADALAQAVTETTTRRRDLDTEIDRRLEARHPLLPDQDVRGAAVDAAYNDRRAEQLDIELAMLARLAERPKPNRRALRAIAAEIIAKRLTGQIRPQEFLVAERRAARKAAREAGRRKYGAALVAKRQEALNAALYSEAREALATAERHVNFARDMDRPTSRKRLGKAGLLGPFEQVMELYSFRPVSDKQRERAATLRGWYDRMIAQGIDPQVPADVMRQIDESRLTHYRDLTGDQLGQVVEVLRLLDFQAKESAELRLAGDKLDLDESAKALSQAVHSALKDRGPAPASAVLARSLGNRAKHVARTAASMLLRLRTLGHWIDGEGAVQGAFYRFVLRPLDRAQAAYLDAMDDYGNKVVELFETHLKGRELDRPIWIASIRQNLTRSDILAVALNTGNASNLQRMQDGRGWGDLQMMEILGHMEKADWEFVQAVWDTLETLWPKIAKQHERLTGIAPPKIEPTRVVTPFGTYAGGYYPLVYDRDSTQWRAFVAAETDSFFDQLAVMALPPNGHTKERVHKARLPVKLDLQVIPGHLSSILKDLTHRETIIGIRKLMKHEQVVTSFSDTIGPQFLDMIEDKLRHVATDQVAEFGRAIAGLTKVSRGVRRHVGIMAQGLNVTSGLKQLIGVSNAYEVMLARHGRSAAPLLLEAYFGMFKRGAVESVMAVSGEMRHRLSTADTDIRLNMQRYLSGQMAGTVKGRLKNLHDGAVAHAYVFIRYVQTYCVDLPLWIAAHEGALKKGLSGDDAIAAADDVVITSQGAGGAKDTALIEGQVPFVEWLTMFYSYGSAYLNRQASMGRQIGQGIEGGAGRIAAEMPLLMARIMFLSVIPVILDDLINQITNAAEGPDDDEGWASYYAKRAAVYQFYGLPFVRDLASAEYGYRLSPASSIGESYQRLARDVRKTLGGDSVEARRVARDAMQVTGYTLGLPLAGPWKHVDYLWRVLEGEEQPESVPEFAGATLVGRREDR